jgi:hypothetical protein
MLLTPFLSGTYNTVTIIDKFLIKWSGFYSTEQQALTDLNKQLEIISKRYTIIESDKQCSHRHFKGYYLYNFSVSAIPLVPVL